MGELADLDAGEVHARIARSGLTTAPSQPIALQGAPNFRDLGGVPAADGRRVRPGLLYRSESLARLTERDLATLESLGIELVCDLRSERERVERSSRWSGAEVMAVDVLTDARIVGNERLADVLSNDADGARARDYVLHVYRALPRAFCPYLRQLVERLLERRQLPLLIHCAAGKDRTGFVAALLLLALGAEREAVEKEYMESDRHFGSERLAEELAGLGAGPPTPAAVESLRCRPEYLASAIDAMKADHGSIAGYLEDCGGLDARRLEQLRDLLLEAA